jgi:hypothetical protein
MSTPTVRTYTQKIAGAPGSVFPLLCPVREGEWLEGWSAACQLIWSHSGVAEEGCVFRTTGLRGHDATWVITAHDPHQRIVEFAQFVEGLAVVTLHIDVAEGAAGTSLVAIRYVATPINAAGVAYVAEAYAPDAFDRMMRWWERSMNHFLATGSMFEADPEA